MISTTQDDWKTMFVLYCLLTYFIASIPFGLIIGFLGYSTDIRQMGSHNIGMTNVWRTLGFAPAVLTLLGDAGKGWAVVYFSKYTDPCSLTILAIVAILGHCYSLFLQGKGGKGVATAFGTLLAIHCSVAGWILSIWIIVRIISRKSSLSAFAALSTLPVLIWYYIPAFGWLAAVLPLIILWQHRENIQRLQMGTES